MTAPTARPGAHAGKILGIELLRFATSLAVLVFHYQHFAYIGAVSVGFVVSQQPFYQIFSLFYNFGFYGVQVFWCISGFIFFWKYGRLIAEASLGSYRFFILRLSRLYPLHFVTLLFVAAMQFVYFAKHGGYFVYQYNDVFHFILQLFMASDWGLQAGYSFNGPIWSISIEVLVYAVFFLLLRYVSCSPLFIGCVALAAVLVQFLKISTHPFFACLMFFFMGCLTAIVYERSAHRATVKQFVTACALLLAVTVSMLSLIFNIGANYFLVLFTPALIFLCVAHIPESRQASGLLIPAGNMTYASYLLHIPIQILVVTCCSYVGIRPPFLNPVFFIGFMAVTLLMSHWTYKYFEMPAQRRLRNLLLPRRGVDLKAVD